MPTYRGEVKRPDHRGIRNVAAMLAVLVFAAGCGDPSPSAVPSSSDLGSPVPPAGRVLVTESLPSVSLDPATQTAVCDLEAGQLDSDAGEATMHCPDGIALGLRALSTISSSPIERLYLQRPTCHAKPCTEDELSTATVIGWTATDVTSVGLDSRRPTVEVTPAAAAVWPSGSSATPAIHRPVIDGAPAEVAGRTAYPYCGEVELGEPEAVSGCFRDAVLAGRPVELIDRYVGTEEGIITRIYRFDGRGAIRSYLHTPKGWLRQVGAMILGPTPGAFDFDPWSGADHRF